MAHQITDSAELDALPVGSVVLDVHGYAWQSWNNRGGRRWDTVVRGWTGQPAETPLTFGPVEVLRRAKAGNGDLRGFLLARVSEDEDVARKVLEDQRRLGSADGSRTSDLWGICRVDVVAVCADATRVLRECEGIRRIAAESRHHEDPNDPTTRDLMRWVLYRLAARYSDHPDFDPTWEPE